jgi:hypothetical protein
MVQALLDFSSCNNTLVGYTNKDGAYIVKSYGNLVAYYDGEEVSYDEDPSYESDLGRINNVRKGFAMLAKRTARLTNA